MPRRITPSSRRCGCSRGDYIISGKLYAKRIAGMGEQTAYCDAGLIICSRRFSLALGEVGEQHRVQLMCEGLYQALLDIHMERNNARTCSVREALLGGLDWYGLYDTGSSWRWDDARERESRRTEKRVVLGGRAFASAGDH